MTDGYITGGSNGKESACNAGGDAGPIPVLGKSPGEGMQPTPVFLLGEIHGQKSLAGYSPWDHRVRHDWATNTHTEWLDLPGKIYGAR